MEREGAASPAINRTLLQYFEWYLPADCSHWRRAAGEAPALARAGFTGVWLPPAYKGASGVNDVGYGVYDLYDLGEFDQKGSVPTKYGTRDEYLAAVRAMQANGIRVYADIVLNHRMGADACEEVEAVRDDAADRSREIGAEEKIEAWTRFTFPGRAGKYSDFQWNWTHFDGVDWDNHTRRQAVYQFGGKQWDAGVDSENGNYDYLMGADLDMSNPEVRRELEQWGRWYLETAGVDGLRLDAVKHISSAFYAGWLMKMRAVKSPLPAVGEYWKPDLATLESYLDACGGAMSLFDVPLHYNFHAASNGGGHYDMRALLNGSLSQSRPGSAVTFVDNHDTQPGQALQSWVQGWFKPIAYAVILLREQGTPCVFYGDWFGIAHDGIQPVGRPLAVLLRARVSRAYGPQHDYFDDGNVVGFTREGDGRPHTGLAALFSDGAGGTKRMYVGERHAGQVFYDCMGNCPGRVTVEEDGTACFTVNGGAVSVWIEEVI